MEPAPGVRSDVDRLTRVIVHRPGAELSRLTPANCERMLFDELPWAERAASEHDALVAALRSHDVDVLLLSELLTTALAHPAARKEAIAAATPEEVLGRSLSARLAEHLDGLDDPSLAATLIAGVAFDELGPVGGSLVALEATPNDFALAPLPNHLFARDACVWVGSAPWVATMQSPARRREATHIEIVLRFHPAFGGGFSSVDSPLEGGDVVLAGSGCVLVGMGERSSPAAVEQFARGLFDTGDASTVVAVQLPHERAAMHLDTVLTMVDRDAFTVYPGIVDRGRAYRLSPSLRGIVIEEGDLRRLLCNALDQPLRFLPTGGDPMDQRREQWNDANNVLALRPGVVIAYDRNRLTNDVLRSAGVEVIEVPSSELGRGRGGPRCLTCPVERSPL